MSVLATKPAPLALGSREAAGNRVELLPHKNPLVAQLLDDFVASGNLPRSVARQAPKPVETVATRPASAAPAPVNQEVTELRLRVEHLEKRLRTLEASAASNSGQQSIDMSDRVVAVLEQLIAELRER